MNKRAYIVFVLFFLVVFAVSTVVTKAESQIELTPTSGAPGDPVHVEGTEFAASKAAGIGLGDEVVVVNEVVTTSHPAPGNTNGFISKHPIKPGSVRWSYFWGATQLTSYDNGNGTLYDPSGDVVFATVNYATGFFNKTMAYQIETAGDTFNYTTYQFDVTPDGLSTDGSGMLSENFTVPDEIWNGTHTVTVIDEAGNKATSDFTVYGSDFIPEPFTVGAFVLLTSTAIVVSFYWLKKKPTNKIAKYS
jgi:hypothetical protein